MKTHNKKCLTLVGASKFRKKDLLFSLDLAPDLVAVDGGANRLNELGIIPNYIVGDMDSVIDLEFFSKKNVQIFKTLEQDTTDFDKSLRVFGKSEYIFALGFLGRRNDHSLGVFSTLVRHHDRKIILIDKHDIIFLMPHSFVIDLPKKTRVSLFPFSDVKGLKSKGLKYPIDGINFSPCGMIGISNETVEKRLEIEIDSRKMLMILPRKYLMSLINQLNMNW